MRVVICVNMLGEGFDFPRLKVAALHDVHSSLPVTIQFTGRFTRAVPRLGGATVIANMADQSMQNSLADLYAEDADWNELLTTKSEEAVSRHIGRGAFIAGFTGPDAEIPLRTMRPKIGAVIYRTGCKGWSPARALDALPRGVSLFDGPRHNRAKDTFLFVTKEEEAIAWPSWPPRSPVASKFSSSASAILASPSRPSTPRTPRSLSSTDTGTRVAATALVASS